MTAPQIPAPVKAQPLPTFGGVSATIGPGVAVSNSVVDGIDGALAALGARSALVRVSHRIRYARALLAILVDVYRAERDVLVATYVATRPDGSPHVDVVDGGVRLHFRPGVEAEGTAKFRELTGLRVELPAGVPLFSLEHFEAAGIQATDAELAQLGPVYWLAAPSD